MSSWYDPAGNQIFGLKTFNFVQNYLGTAFLQGLDKLIVYHIASELRLLCRTYGLLIGGGGVTEDKRIKGKQHNKVLLGALKQFDETVSANFGNLDIQFVKQYGYLIKNIQPIASTFLPKLIRIGKLQLLRKLLVRQIHFAARVESQHYESCLVTMNYSLLHNLDEIKENAKRAFLEQDEQLLGLMVSGNDTMLNNTKLLTP